MRRYRIVRRRREAMTSEKATLRPDWDYINEKEARRKDEIKRRELRAAANAAGVAVARAMIEETPPKAVRRSTKKKAKRRAA